MALTGFAESDCRPVQPNRRACVWYRAFQEFLLSHGADYSAFAQMLGDRDGLSLDEEPLLRLHDRAIQFLHWKLSGELRRHFTDCVTRFVDETVGDVGGAVAADADSVAVLDERGFAALPPIGAGQVSILLEWLDAGGVIPADRLQDYPPQIAACPAAELRKGENLGQVPRDHLIRTPGLSALATDPFVLAIVRRHLGAPPILINVAAWRSFAGEDGAKDAKNAQLFHSDLDDYRFCKMFVYLTDVDESGGPHVFIPATHRPEVVAALQPPEAAPERADFDEWYFRTLRKSENDVVRWLGIEPVAITGPAGSRIIVNTEGIHRGAPPVDKDRWLLQFVYGVSPNVFWKGEYFAPPLDNPDPAAAYAAQLLFPK